MKCIFCGSLDSKVIDSRMSEDGMSIRRRRECNACGKRFTTYETIELTPIMVVKKNGERQEYSRNKLKQLNLHKNNELYGFIPSTFSLTVQ